MLRLLVDLPRESAPFWICAEIRLGRQRGADTRLDDLPRKLSDLFVSRDEPLNRRLVLLG
jgi:hypothetical protein